MYRRALLVALVVCSMGILFAAAGPASAEVFSETPTPDGADNGSETPDDGSAEDGTEDDADEDDTDEDDSWYSGWGDDDRSENGSDDDHEDADDGSDWGNDDERDDGNETDDGTSNASADPDAGGEGNTSSGGEAGPAEPDDEQGATDRQNETHREDGTDGGPGAADNETADGDEGNQTRSLTERVLALSNETVRTVTDGVSSDIDGDGDPDVQLVDIDDGSVRVGGLTGESSEGTDGADEGVSVVEVELDDEFVDDRGRLRAGNVTIGGVLVVPLGPPEILASTSADQGPGGRPAPDMPTPDEALAEATAPDEPASVAVAEPDTSEPDETGGTDDGSEPATGAGDDDGEDGAGGPPGSGAGAGAALVVTVGLLGGTRTAVDQTALLASQGSGNTLTTLRHAVAGYLDDLPGGALLALFGYSRHDSSDPLENETRAQIYDIVRESPGTYHAQLAEETGVAVETVRYHSRILAEEGLVEARKIRGRRRLFPVTMDDDEPELAAAIADSAASDVLSVIERREPTTLSAIAEAVDCAPSTVSYHVDRLEDDGLVTRERDGGAVRVQLRRSTRSALQGQVADD